MLRQRRWYRGREVEEEEQEATERERERPRRNSTVSVCLILWWRCVEHKPFLKRSPQKPWPMATPRGCSAHARLMRPSSFSAAAAFRLLHAYPFSARDRLWPPAFGRGRDFLSPARALTAEAPSCLYVGPVETATKERLEELYQQARESYYDGNPLIIDDMFDKIELKLRLYGSKSVVKYPRCSLRRQSTYADAEEDPSQEFALASIWLLLLAFGSTAIFVPVIYVISLAFADNISSRYFFYSERSTIGSLEMVNKTLTLVLGCLIGFPLAYASIQALKGLWRSELVAMRGSCPNCGEEVFTFVRAESSSDQLQLAHCHVCECALEFQTKVEQSFSRPGRRWVYGRVYLVQQS